MEELKLNCEDERIIRKYILRMSVPIVAFVGATSFFLGYIIQQSTDLKAQAELLKIETNASEQLKKIANESRINADNARDNFQRALEKIEDQSKISISKMESSQRSFSANLVQEQLTAAQTLAKISALRNEAEKLQEKIFGLKEIESLSELENNIFSRLLEDADFRNDVASSVVKRVAASEREVDEKIKLIESKLDKALSNVKQAAVSLSALQSESARHAQRLDRGVIRNATGLCLDAHEPCKTQNGCKVQVWECNGSAHQSWSLR